MIDYNELIYKKLGKRLKWLSKIGAGKREMSNLPKKRYDTLLVGCDRAGSVVLKQLLAQGRDTLVVDFNPELLRKLIKKNIACIYGDIADPEVIEHINFKNLWLTISSIPDYSVNKELISLVHKRNRSCLVFVTANTSQEALRLYELGADYVILPHLLGGEHVALMLKHKLAKIQKDKTSNIRSMRKRHILDLKERLEL